MPEKKDKYSSYGQKLISLFVRLLFYNEAYSLTELASKLNCSKQTVLKLLQDIRKSYGVELEESKVVKSSYYRLKGPQREPIPIKMTDSELSVLYMCRDFTAHLLGKKLFEEATKALLKNHGLPGERKTSFGHFASLQTGYIDYTPYYGTINTLIEAMDKRLVCKMSYKAIMETTPKNFYIKPFKLFSHKDTVYLHAGLAKDPEKKYREPKFNPLLAVHRIDNIELTTRQFSFPRNYNFEKTYDKSFGIIKEDKFEVEVEFTGWSARYVAERVWSPDQNITKLGKNKIRLTFTASSEPELLSWVLSFGEEGKLLRPVWLKERILNHIRNLNKVYECMP